MKAGEIVFDSSGNVEEVNGYDNNRKSFEFIELSEYYEKMEELKDLLDDIKIRAKDAEDLIKRIT